MSATVLSFFRPAPTTTGDWSRQEVAEFYRVEAASVQSGLRLSMERGLSDEGDPWLVFCREDGEVFLHFARIDGAYVICSDLIEAPLTGPDFRALLAELVRRNPSVLPLPRPGTTGQSGAQILLHPAALLAAIVATACLFASGNEAVAGEFDVGDAADPAHAPIAASPRGHAAGAVPVASDAPAPARHDDDREYALITGVILTCITAFTEVAVPSKIPNGLELLAEGRADQVAAQATSAATLLPPEPSAASGFVHPTVTLLRADANSQGGEATAAQASPAAWQRIEVRESSLDLATLPTIASGVMPGHEPPGTSVTPGDAADLALRLALDVAGRVTHGASARAAETSSTHDRGGSVETGGDGAHANAAAPSASSGPTVESQRSVTAATSSPSETTSRSYASPSPAGDLEAKGSVADVVNKPVTGSGTSLTLVGSAAPIANETAGSMAKTPTALSSEITTLTAKTMSLLLHALVDTPTTAATTSNMSSAATVTSPFTSLVTTVQAATGVLTEASSASSASVVDAATKAASALATSTTTVAHTLNGTAVSFVDTAAGSETGLSTKTAAPTNKTVLDTAASGGTEATPTIGTGAASPVLAASKVTTDDHSTTLASQTTASGGLSKGAADASATTVAAASTASAPVTTPTQVTTAGTEALHADALHTIAALVSSTNTVSRAISVSFAGEATPLDAAQLRIIDLFLTSTPDVKFRTVDNTLEIYDPSASSDGASHASVWDIGGGTLVRVVGIVDSHATS